MAIENILEICLADGRKMYDVAKFNSAEYARGINRVGKATFTLPVHSTSAQLLALLSQRDTRINILRSIDGAQPYLDMEMAWFTRRLELTRDLITVSCVDAMTVLDRRIIAYYASATQTRKTTTAADDMIKAIARENISSTASDYGGSAVRGLAAARLSVQADMTKGAVISKEFAWRSVLPAFQEIASTSYENGTYLAFDVVVADHATGALQLRTYTGKRGVDRRDPTGTRPILLSEDNGNLNDAVLTYDYTQEVTWAYAGGKGQENLRVVEEGADTQRAAASPFNRIEVFVNAATSDDTAAVEDEATAAVFLGQPLVYVSGEMVETLQCRRGIHFEFGDIVTAEVRGIRNDYVIDGIDVLVSPGKPTTSKVSLLKYYG
jgi:hypothetical protein